ncbi:hypothetical protein HDE_00984 [Halotydeus destructor]|nr:hypothetical protein HDE_00984 [Halotydeus destructor]
MIWLLMTFALFILSSGYFLNLMGTEQVAKRSPDQVETLNDVISQKFEHIEPTMVTNAFTYALDKLVKPGSNEEKVFKKLRRPGSNFISVDPEKNKDNRTVLGLGMQSIPKIRFGMSNKVSNRFHSYNLKTLDCKVAKFRLKSILDLDYKNQVHQVLLEMNTYATMNLNCTEIETEDIRSGEIDEYGNYSGVVGMIQRKEVDYGLAWMRSDCLATESLDVLATIFEADVRIVSPILNESAKGSGSVEYQSVPDNFEPFLDTFTLVDQSSYYCFLAAIFAVALIISIDKHRRNLNIDKVSLFSKQYAHALWEVFELIVGQGKGNDDTNLLRMMWLMWTVGLFIIISGVFLNLLRTEQVAQRTPAQIETMEDIVGPNFKGIQPTLVTNTFTYALSKLNLKPESNEKKLFDKLNSHDGNLIYMDSPNKTKNTATIPGSIGDAKRKKDRYFLIEEVLWSQLKPVLCHSSPDDARQIRTSGKPILGGLLITPMAKSVNFRLKKYTEYRLKNQFEFGISNSALRHVFERLGYGMGQWILGKTNSTMCLLDWRDEDSISDMVFKLEHCKLILSSLASLLMSSVLVNIVEYLVAGTKAANRCTTKRNQIQPIDRNTVWAEIVVEHKILASTSNVECVECLSHNFLGAVGQIE